MNWWKKLNHLHSYVSVTVACDNDLYIYENHVISPKMTLACKLSPRNYASQREMKTEVLPLERIWKKKILEQYNGVASIPILPTKWGNKTELPPKVSLHHIHSLTDECKIMRQPLSSPTWRVRQLPLHVALTPCGQEVLRNTGGEKEGHAA